MKKNITRRLMTALLAAAMCVSMAACGSKTDDTKTDGTDNTAASCTETIGSIVLNAKTPVVAGEKGLCTGCGVATLSISYYDLGYKTGEMAAQVLTGEADIAEMPIQYAPATKMYNPTMCEALGITAPEGYEAME